MKTGYNSLEIYFFFRRLNLFFLNLEKKQKIIKKTGLTYTKTLKNFEYEKNNEKY